MHYNCDYEYVVFFTFNGGVGRKILQFKSPLNTERKMLEVEAYISQQMGVPVCLTNFILLRKTRG